MGVKGDSYRPDWSGRGPQQRPRRRSRSPEVGFDTKRRKTGGGYRDRADTGKASRSRGRVTQLGGGESYRPSYEEGSDVTSKAPRDARDSDRGPDHYEPPHEQPSASPTSHNNAQSGSNIQHDRTSLSSKIHSLKRQLERADTMPPPIRMEKERELAGYMADQQTEKLKTDQKKQRKRYQMVRFIEKQKAERRLRVLLKQKVGDPKGQANQATPVPAHKLDEAIYEAEADLAYTVYTPLASKYIGIFASGDPKDRKIEGMPKKHQAALGREKILELIDERDAIAGLAHNRDGEKPPGWYEVKKLMGDEMALERLRDSIPHAQKLTLAQLGGRKATSGNVERPPWLDDDGMIDSEDLDSDNTDGGVAVDVQDESQSDDEFFER